MTDPSDIRLWVSDGSTERALTRPLEVGSHPRSDFRSSEPGVLERHLRLVPDPRGARLLPGSGATVTVNGVPQSAPQGLMPGDRIGLGTVVLEVFAANAGTEHEKPWCVVSADSAAVTYLSDELRIGRDVASDICLQDIHASRYHANLLLRAGSAWIRDLGSRNGSYVNGERVRGATRLFSGDELRFDRAVFRVFGPDMSLSVDPDEEHRSITDRVRNEPAAALATRATAQILTAVERSGGRPHAGFYLVESTTTGSGEWHRLLSGRTIIGRARDCDLRLQDRSVSAHHCEIQRGPGGMLLRDLGSSNGTRINERRIRTSSVREGDRITIGRVQVSLREIRPLRRAGGWLRWLRRIRHSD